MKKLMALLVVAGMVFVACNNKPAEEPAVAEEAVTEEVAPVQPEAAPATTEEAPAQPEAAPAN